MSNFEYRYEDFQHDWPERVFGSETEYTAGVFGELAVLKSFGEGLTDLIDYVDEKYAVSTGRYMRTSAITTYGGELYIDMHMLEYATGEANTPRDVVLQERAGETITADTATAIAQYHPEALRDTPDTIYKRGGYPHVFSSEGELIQDEVSVGNHENYYSVSDLAAFNWYEARQEGETLDPQVHKHPSVQFMSSYLIVRKLFDGAGMIGEDGFSLSQKPTAFNFTTFDGSVDHGTKPAFWVHDDRFEVRTGENNKSDWVIEEKFGLTSLILRLVEHQHIPTDLILAEPSVALRDIAQNPNATVRLQSGAERKASDVLKSMVDRAAEFAYAENSLLPYEEKAIYEFDKFYKDLKTVNLPDNEIGSLGYVDWAARFRFFTDRGATFGKMHAQDFSLVKQDLIWDQIRENDIARKYLSRLGGAALTVPAPVPSQRAQERIAVARALYNTGDLMTVKWEEITSIDETRDTLLPNPRGGNIKFRS